MTKRIHLDTDLGGDTDDACALARLLALPDVELTGVTTSADPEGLRAGCVEHVLRLAGREDVPVAAGAGGSLGGLRDGIDITDPQRYWPEGVSPRPAPPGAALDLLARGVRAGATVVGVGPYTNLALLEVARPGLLATAEVVLMGGCVTPVSPGLPAWGPAEDYNVYQDMLAARLVWERCDPVLVQLAPTLEATLRAAHLPRLRGAGALGRLLALQAELHAGDSGMSRLGRAHARLPDDLLNFQYDALACAVALGWEGARVERLPLLPREEAGYIRPVVAADGRPTWVVTSVDGARFEREWLDAVAPPAEDPTRG
jgi:inosine-uridine nucleoside N-ribohydrolase